VKRHEVVRSVRGVGMLLAVELDSEKAGEVVQMALSRGLLVNSVTPSAIRMCPPLIVEKSHCDEAVDILDQVLGSLAEERN
jgi:acetylornithine/N-succinyldiaminopimelate aminotransferase